MGEKQSNVMVENMPNPLIHTPESMQHKHSLSINQSISLLGQISNGRTWDSTRCLVLSQTEEFEIKVAESTPKATIDGDLS